MTAAAEQLTDAQRLTLSARPARTFGRTATALHQTRYLGTSPVATPGALGADLAIWRFKMLQANVSTARNTRSQAVVCYTSTPAPLSFMKRLSLLTLLAAATLAGAACSQSERAPARLTPETYASVKAHAQPKPQDLLFESIGWHENLVDGANEARKQDRPLVLWLYFGDPRGGC